jgi:hypothetical protein
LFLVDEKFSHMLVHDTLIPARFMLLLSHFMATIMVSLTKVSWSNQDSNIYQSLALTDTKNYHILKTSLTISLILCWICFGVEVLTMLFGLSMFSKPLNAYCKQVSCRHFCSWICYDINSILDDGFMETYHFLDSRVFVQIHSNGY